MVIISPETRDKIIQMELIENQNYCQDLITVCS